MTYLLTVIDIQPVGILAAFVAVQPFYRAVPAAYTPARQPGFPAAGAFIFVFYHACPPRISSSDVLRSQNRLS